MNQIIRNLSVLFFASILSVACQEQATQKTTEKKAEAPKPAEAKPALVGVDMATKTVSIGALNDESGPAAVLGKPFALGKRILAKQINAGGSGILPEGWKINLVERDHGYNPGKSEAAYKEIKDKVLFFGTTFGTPNTLPLRPFLKQDNIVAFPASLSSEMANFEFTPPVGASYVSEAHRALDWALEQAGGADKLKVAIVYDQTDYGKDGHKGLMEAAKFHKVNVVAEQTIAPGQKDFTAVIAALKKAQATHILLTVLPSSTGPILGTAAKMKYMPTWMGNTPSWVDPFFAHPQLPAAVFTNYYWVNSMPFWGEKLPGMDKFLDAFGKYGKEMGRPDFYILVSYLHGLSSMQVLSKAIAANDLSRAGFLKALKSLKGWDADGMIKPQDFTKMPYETTTMTRILKPDFVKKSWIVTADYAEPKAWATPAPAADDKAEKPTTH